MIALWKYCIRCGGLRHLGHSLCKFCLEQDAIEQARAALALAGEA